MDSKRKRSIDVILVEIGLAPDLEHARTLISCDLVLCKDKTLNAKSKIAEDEIPNIRIKHQKRFVSRGAVKLQTVFDKLSEDNNSALYSSLEPDIQPVVIRNFTELVNGKVCFDIGASTGGFTQLLLEKGAAKVFAIDVGTGILDNKLRQDKRVVVMEGINVRNINEYPKAKEALSTEPADICVIDVSFISLAMIIPAITPFIKKGALIVPLVKPQFEAEKHEIGDGGIITDDAVRQKSLKKIEKVLIDNNYEILDVMESQLKGMQGNIEYFYVARLL